jgi:Arc/MetJ-type ribon-helix-helix transcriptional regulator
MDTATVKTKLPVRLLSEMESLVHDGWFEDLDDLIADALRRYLDSHRPDLMERYIRKDIEWGLHGEE